MWDHDLGEKGQDVFRGQMLQPGLLQKARPGVRNIQRKPRVLE
jgi:hypothetical protein